MDKNLIYTSKKKNLTKMSTSNNNLEVTLT